MNIILSLYNLFNTSKKKKIWDTTTWNQLLFYNALKKPWMYISKYPLEQTHELNSNTVVYVCSMLIYKCTIDR